MFSTKKINYTLSILLLVILTASFARPVQPVSAGGVCGTGTWTTGNLEIHHINIGQGDSALIVGPTGKSLLLDAGESTWNSSAKAQIIGSYIESVLGCKSLDYVLISHFHLDHVGYVGYGGLWNLVEVQSFTVGTTLVRDYNSYLGSTSGTFTHWKTYLEGDGQATLHPVTVVEGTGQVDLGPGVTLDIVALDGNGAIIAGNFSGDSNPPSENDYSIGAILSYGNFDEWLGGDLDGEYQTGGFGYTYHDIELSVAPEVGDVDVYRANHHGSAHSSSATFINQLDPEVSVISAGNGNSYGHPTQETMDRLLATSVVYLTERGELSTNIGSAIVSGNIVIKTSEGTSFTVNGTPYVATEPSRTDTDADGYFAEADPDDNNTGLIPSPNGGCGPTYQTCSVSTSCQVTSGQVLINEVLPAPASASDPEWVELYNTTASTLNIGYCYIDDIVAGSAAYQIPAGTLIPAHGFWTLDRTTYFNNTGDDVRFLKEDASTVLDTFTYGNTGSNLSWYRLPDGGTWAGSATASTTKGQSNTLPFYPIVYSSTRVDDNPSHIASVAFTVTFSKTVTGVNNADFNLTTTGVTGASIANVSGSGTTYTVTVNTGSGDGTIRLDVVDNDSIQDASNNPLGGGGAGNGSFSSGEVYTMVAAPTDADVDVHIAGAPMGNYVIRMGGRVTPIYPGINNGPVQVVSTNGVPIITSERAYRGLNFTDWNEMLGFPVDQLTTEYWFPLCDGTGTAQTFISIGNASQTPAEVTVKIAGQILGNYTIPVGGRVTPGCPGINNGPVQVYSTNGTDIIVSERAYRGLNYTDWNEMLGLPVEQLTTEYWFPLYDTTGTAQTFISIGNTSPSTAAEVSVYIAGNLMDSYTIPLGGRVTPIYDGINNGPVRVVSTNGVPIITSERAYRGPNYTDWNEMLGLPVEQLTTEYWFPLYDTTGIAQTFISIGNASP